MSNKTAREMVNEIVDQRRDDLDKLHNLVEYLKNDPIKESEIILYLDKGAQYPFMNVLIRIIIDDINTEAIRSELIKIAHEKDSYKLQYGFTKSHFAYATLKIKYGCSLTIPFENVSVEEEQKRKDAESFLLDTQKYPEKWRKEKNSN